MSSHNPDSLEFDISQFTIAVILPCLNEAIAIPQVISEFKQALPSARIYVFDNNSADQSAEKAQAAGATVYQVREPGKGNVVRRMFADVEADIYVIADSDMTYNAADSEAMIQRLVRNKLDMIVGHRVDEKQRDTYRAGHRVGNYMLSFAARSIFGGNFKDMLSGYRIFSRRFVKSFPALSDGFEIETELTIHALKLRMPVDEYKTLYRARPPGSTSKLSTYKDGMRIIKTLCRLFMVEHPLSFYSITALLFIAAGVALSIPIFIEFFETGLVPRLPTAILVVGLTLCGFISFACGLILDTVSRGRHETRRLAYLAISPLTTD